ncbi:hypothetical protein SAMN05216410_2330 [Sanguibacter gelidistatuariae]|uniref:GIY-YIG domain-containing protein n=1 Tax=Sanguibacter gelidistatuariae TaxID=1814289 RepID=A0A1G6PR80_9MICO|nr:hypothetical protein [Sanguibacter gelidistatuariae]SDC82481.1 hypothetical protein SAMN05216410_2330 [Sanguibacter gelidistatuariae]
MTVSWPWASVPAPTFTPATSIAAHEIPSSPGVYAWVHDDEVVYLGVAASGLRSRIRTHLGTAADLSRSAFRRSVAGHVLTTPAASSRKRLSTLDVKDLAVVNAWVRECSLGWIETTNADEARELEDTLLSKHRPPLNKQ